MPYQEQYGNPTLDTIHSFFPALLYDNQGFTSVPQVFAYINDQMDHHFNLFSSGRLAYLAQRPSLQSRLHARPPPPLHQRPPLPQPAYQIPLTYTDIVQAIYPGHSGITDILSSLMQPPQQIAMEPVIVRPTFEQISENTIIEINATEGEMCSICQDVLPVGGEVRTITHCEHSFHTGCIDTWFQRNVRCPVCRHDIRESEPSQ
jgi:hypothetical protein